MQYLYIGYPTAGHRNPESRFAEFIPILTQADLPGKGASGRRCMYPFDFEFFTGCNQRYIQVAA